jgi:ubiquinone/menaquinone biosynthesis C-methylase UbiE
VVDDEAAVLYEEFAQLEAIWGEGFMSPGGAEEIGRIVAEADLAGARVLDLGCGAGGASIVLLERHGAAEVTGVDPMVHLVEYCRRRAERLDLGGPLRYAVLPADGRLAFPDGCFDAVFSKDALLHVVDKPTALKELHRVLRPGGRLLVSDWLRGQGSHLDAEVESMGQGVWTMVTLEQIVGLVESCGFVVDEVEDRRAWYADLAAAELARFDSEWGRAFAQRFGQEDFDGLRGEWSAFAAAARSGALSPGHVRATKPG